MSKRVTIDECILIEMYRKQQLSIPEISRKLSIPRATVYNNIKRYKLCRSIKDSLSISRIAKKRKQRVVQKYGVKNVSQLDAIKKKKEQSSLKKYGVKNVRSASEIKMKIERTICLNYNVKNRSEFRQKIQQQINNQRFINKQTQITESLKLFPELSLIHYESQTNSALNEVHLFCNNCGKNVTVQKQLFDKRIKNDITPCTECVSFKKGTSQLEKELQDFIRTLGVRIQVNTRKVIAPKELDIFLPDFNLAIEFNGLYWHSDAHERIHKMYHVEKTVACELKQIQLIHVWENDWIYKREIVMSRLKNLIHQTSRRIFARKCQVREVTNSVAREFFNRNHLQGFVGACKHYALYYDEEIVSCMSFGQLRRSLGSQTDSDSYELLRFCNLINTVVVGSANKLFKYFIKCAQPKFILSYASREWSTNIYSTIYDKLGFKFDGVTQPNYSYYKDGALFHRFNFRKDKLVREGFDSNKTEKQIMKERLFFRIYNVGNLKYVYVL